MGFKVLIRGKLVSVNIEERDRGNYRLVFRVSGKKQLVNTGKAKAKEVTKSDIARLVQEWEAGEKKPAPEPIQPAEPARGMKWAMEEFFRLRHAHTAPGTVEEYRRTLGLLGTLAEWPEVGELTKSRFRSFWPVLSRDEDGNPLAAKTLANRLGTLGQFARFLVDEDLILQDFTAGIQRPKKEHFGTHEEIYREEWFPAIWDELPKEWRPVWEDFWYTGMDAKDIFLFEPRKHLQLIDGNLKIWKQRAKESEIIDQPVSSSIRERWLSRYHEAGRGEFLHPWAHEYATLQSWRNRAVKVVHAAQKKAGLPLLDIKATRHTFATRHLMRMIRREPNAPTLDEVRRWLGHAKDSRVLERIYFKLLSQPDSMD